MTGQACKLSAAESLKYFVIRPRGSQLAAWVRDGEIPLPSFWTGYRALHQTIEFSQGGRDRLHDRFEYIRSRDSWTIERLAP